MGLVDGSTTLQLRLALEGLDRMKPVHGENLLFQDNLHTPTAHRSGLCALEWLVIWSAKSCKVRAQGDTDGWLTARFFLLLLFGTRPNCHHPLSSVSVSVWLRKRKKEGKVTATKHGSTNYQCKWCWSFA